MSFGQALPDQVERIAALFDCHLEVIGDVRDIYKDRVVLEREYAIKLQALAKKAVEKKAKTEALFVLGNDPTKAWDHRTLKESTLNSAYDEVIGSIVASAEDHNNIADALGLQVIDVLKVIEKKNEEAKKKEMLFFQKLLADRDKTNNDRLKSKMKYDEECGEVESQRQKQSKSSDDRHADRISRQTEQQRNDMLNGKNVYIISTAIANSMKAKFYADDLPNIENQFQSIQTRLVERFAKILIHAQALQLSHFDALKSRLSQVESSFKSVNPAQDQALFIEYNIRPFNMPPDYQFEPCATFYDTDAISIEDAPKIFLQNKLAQSQIKLKELGPVMNEKRKESEQLAKLVQAYTADVSLGNIDEVSDNSLEARHQLAYFATSECILQAEVDTIISAVGDDIGGQQPHAFKSTSFSIPATCGYCKASIWGLSKQGKTCKSCGICVHSKCELKIPADCHKGGIKRSSTSVFSSPVSRATSTASTLRPSNLAPTDRIQPTPSSFVNPTTEEEVSYPTARVLFDFVATSAFELHVTDGEMVQVLEPDDGSGWIKVIDSGGHDGLVPASYLEYEGATPVSKISTPTVRGSSGQYVQAIYEYQAQGSDEISLGDGEMVELSSGPTGGQHYGDGWWEGINSKGQKGIFPSNYVKVV